LTESDLTDPEVVFQIGLPPNRVDILSAIPGVEFTDCWKRRAHASFDGVPTPVISRVDLIRNKRATGRLQDLADASALSILEASKSRTRRRMSR